MVNVSRPSLIRTEADELTYPVHVLIRYELEKEIFGGHVETCELEKLWNDKYQSYLGVCAARSSEGILQDIHWSAGDFGYFPTYALGSAYAAQFSMPWRRKFLLWKRCEREISMLSATG